MHQNVKKLCVLAMISALAFVMVMAVRIPVVQFLKYEPKDVIITVGGFLYGPLATVIVSVVVSFIEMITISDTGWIGFVMNVLSTVSFAGIASFVYKKKHTISGAVIGLVLGTAATTAIMLGWNYILTPLYMEGSSRADVASLLVPVFLPFNLLKGTLNSAITILLYRPLVKALRGAKLFPKSTAAATTTSSKLWLYIVTVLVLMATIVLVVLFRNGVL